MEIKDVTQLRGWEDQIKDGVISIGYNTVHGSGTDGEITKWDLQDLFDMLSHQEKLGMSGPFVTLTGYAGYWRIRFRISFDKYGRSKLPRKLKKRVFGRAKDRRRCFPEYYKIPVYIKKAHYGINC